MKKRLYALVFLVTLSIFATTACTSVHGEVAEYLELSCKIFVDVQEWGTLYRFERNGLWGFKNASENIVIEPQYYTVHDFSEGLAFVRGVRGREDQTGFIDFEGNLAIPLPTVIHAGHFSEGFAPVVVRPWGKDEEPSYFSHQITGPFIFINREGHNVFGDEFQIAFPFVDGLAEVIRYRGNMEFIDITGQNAFGMEFKWADRFDEDGFAWVHLLDGTRTHLDRNGNIVDRRDAIARATSNEWGSLRPATRDGLWGFHNDSGERVIELQFRHANSFTEGLAFVQGFEGREYQTGFIDYTGELVIPLPNAISAGRFFEGFALVINRRWDCENEEVVNRRIPGPHIFIDRTGQNVFNQEFADARHFIDGIARVQLLNGNIAFIDTSGENVFGQEFLAARDFVGDLVAVTLLDGREVYRARP